MNGLKPLFYLQFLYLIWVLALKNPLTQFWEKLCSAGWLDVHFTCSKLVIILLLPPTILQVAAIRYMVKLIPK